MNTKGHFCIGFEDLSEALDWMEIIRKSQLEWVVYPLSADAFNDATKMAFPIPADMDDVVVATVYCGPQSPVNSSNVVKHVMPLLRLVGYVYSAVVLNPGQNDFPSMVRSYDVEVKFQKLHSALNAIRALNGIRNDVCTKNGPFGVCGRQNANHTAQCLVLEVVPRTAGGGHFATTTKARHDWEASMRNNGKGSLRRTPKTPAKTPRRGTNLGRRPPVTPRTPLDAREDREHAIDLTSIAYGTDGRTAVSIRL
jgi:hypothetical protein